MSDWNELKGTIAWQYPESSSEFYTGVPCFHPQHDNCHLYFAYFLRLYRPTLNTQQYAWVDQNLVVSGLNLRRYKKPENRMSHDEVLGFLFYCWYLGLDYAIAALAHKLRETGGIIPEDGKTYPNVFRMVELESIMAAALKETPTPIQQLAFFFVCISRCFSKRGHASPFLRTWLSVPLMSQFPLPALGLLIFSFGMKIRGYTLEESFAQYFSKVPQIAEQAKVKGWLDP